METIVHKEEHVSDNQPFRFIDRDKLTGRSTGRFNILRVGENSSYIYLEDWYHTLSSLSTGKVILFIVSLYGISVLIWATVFYLFRDYGFVDITTFVAAMIMSLQTITTVGYSVTDINFGDHPIAFFILFCEMMQSILMNSFCIGIIYTRISRAITRCRSLIFSDKAIIRKLNGQWCFVFQTCELRKTQLIESHISCYCVQKTVNSSSGVPFQMTRMQLSHPTESHTGHTLLMLPAVVCHPIDVNSPLYPDIECEEKTSGIEEPVTPLSHRISRCFTSSHLDINRRSITTISDLDTVWPCPICSEVFASQALVDQHLAKGHVQDDQVKNSDMTITPSTESSRDTIDRMAEGGESSFEVKPELTSQLILDNIRKKDFEVVVLVEGIESVTSSKLQARYSYAADDIITNRTFTPCVSIGEDGEAVIDFCKFHETVPIDLTKPRQDSLFMQSIT